MDSHDLFKRLTTNLSFTKQNTQLKEEERNSNLYLNNIKQEQQQKSQTNGKRKVSDVNDEDDNLEREENSIKIIGNLSSNDYLKTQNKQKKQKTIQKLNQIHIENLNHLRNKYHIHVNGDDIPEPIETFNQLFDTYKQIPDKLKSNLVSYNFAEPTPIQMQAIPIMLSNRELIASAQTGSGKTIAFLFPLLANLRRHEKKGFRALILAPTRELVRQTYLECCRLSDGMGIKTYTINDPAKTLKIVESLKKYDILITTPNRLVFMLQQPDIPFKLDNVEWLVIDEADKLFEDGKHSFRDQLSIIYKACSSSNVKHAMFSATYTHEVEEWSKIELNNIIQVSIGRKNLATYTVEQELIYVGNEDGKLYTLRDLFKKGFHPPILVFVESKQKAQNLFKELVYDGINVDVIHSDRTQQQRDNTIRAFRQGKIWVLICTELMGRGIDFKGVNLVVNYDFPQTAISYIHRIGRTGRAGRIGKAVTFFTDDDLIYLRSIANLMRENGCIVPEYMLSLKKQNKKKKKNKIQMNGASNDENNNNNKTETKSNKLKNKLKNKKINKIEVKKPEKKQKKNEKIIKKTNKLKKK